MRTSRKYSGGHMSDEQVRERFRQALSGMDASDETIERILVMTEAEERARMQKSQSRTGHAGRAAASHPHGKLRVRTAVAMAGLTALLATGAYAAVSTDFFQLAFGPKGNEDVANYTVVDEDHGNPATGEPKTWIAPSRTWADVDEQVANTLLDGYVYDLNYTVESHGYTLTVNQCVMDEMGNGIASITLENPEGLQLSDAGYGEVYLSNDAPVYLTVESEDGATWDSVILRDAQESTDTKLVGTVCFGPFSGELPLNSGPSFVLKNRDDGGQTGSAAQDNMGHTFYSPESVLLAKTFTASDGTTVKVSPIGMARYSADSADEASRSIREATIRYTDGSEYTVYRWGGDEPVVNYAVCYGYSEDASQSGDAVVFNRLVDVDDVESVVLRGVTYSGENGTDEQEFELELSAS